MNNKKASAAKNSSARFFINKKLVLEILTLQSPRGRLIAAALVHLVLYIVPYAWLANLSLYKLVRLDWVPSIGLTRAYWLLLHGDLAAAWQQNPLIFPILAVMWSIVALDVYRCLKKDN